jgi:serine/threonine protein phosphatase 1
MANLTYAIADLHGSFDLLESALDAIEQHGASASKRTIVFLGDYIDRGPQSREIIERLMAGAPANWNWICLRGNHEEMMLACLSGRADVNWWIRNGGGATLSSYGHRPESPFDPALVPDTHRKWLRDRPVFHADAFRLFVHAGVDPTLPLEKQSEQTLLWMRYPSRLLDVGWKAKHVVHGHDPFEDGPILLRHRTDLDTLAWRTGRLAVGVFDDQKPGGPIKLIEVVRGSRRP